MYWWQFVYSCRSPGRKINERHFSSVSCRSVSFIWNCISVTLHTLITADRVSVCSSVSVVDLRRSRSRFSYTTTLQRHQASPIPPPDDCEITPRGRDLLSGSTEDDIDGWREWADVWSGHGPLAAGGLNGRSFVVRTVPARPCRSWRKKNTES